MTPGCRNVLNFFVAFLARGKRDLLALISKVKTQQTEPSSYESLALIRPRIHCTHLLSAIVLGPYRFVVVDPVADRIGE